MFAFSNHLLITHCVRCGAALNTGELQSNRTRLLPSNATIWRERQISRSEGYSLCDGYSDIVAGWGMASHPADVEDLPSLGVLPRKTCSSHIPANSVTPKHPDSREKDSRSCAQSLSTIYLQESLRNWVMVDTCCISTVAYLPVTLLI